MGIEQYHKWLNNQYKDCFVSPIGHNIYDYVYLDMNHILHNSMHHCRTEKQFFQRIKENLDNLFHNFMARRRIIMAIDGPSPYAKVILQRQRRLASSRKLDMTQINPLHITPGTELLEHTEAYLSKYLRILFKKYTYLRTKFTVLSSNIPNEGEVKMFAELLKYGKEEPDAKHLVVGNDADLVALAMAARPVNHIYLLGRNGIFDLDQFIKKITKIPNLHTINQSSVRHDLVIVSIMGGNDYLPKMGYVTLDTLFRTYSKYREEGHGCFTSDHGFDSENLGIFLSLLNQKVMLGYRKFNIHKYEEKQIRNYLEGLLWCLEMYRTGSCSKYDYAFTSSGVILPVNVKYYLMFQDKAPMIPYSDCKPLRPEVYTLITMPKIAKSLIPEQYQGLLDGKLKDLYELEECQLCGDHRNQLSELYRQLKIANDADDDNKEVRQKIGDVVRSYNAHKKTHRSPFKIGDLQRILELTETDTDIR